MPRPPRFITTIQGRARALTGEKSLKEYAQKRNMTVEKAKQVILDTERPNSNTPRPIL